MLLAKSWKCFSNTWRTEVSGAGTNAFPLCFSLVYLKLEYVHEAPGEQILPHYHYKYAWTSFLPSSLPTTCRCSHPVFGFEEGPVSWLSYSQIILPSSDTVPTSDMYFSHTKQFCSISEMSYNSTQFWYCLPGNNIRFHRLRTRSYKAAPTTQLRIPITSPGCPCTTYPQAIDRRFQWASPYVWLIC